MLLMLYILPLKIPLQAEKDDIINENKEFAKKFNELIDQINKIQLDSEIKRFFYYSTYY